MTKNPNAAVILLLILMASAGIAKVANAPVEHAIRAVDMVQLTGCGACFGVAGMLLFGRKQA